MGNPVSHKLPQDIDEMLQDLAQMEGLVSYADIMNFGDCYKIDDIQKLRRLNEKLTDEYNKKEKFNKSTLEKVKDIVINRIYASRHDLPAWKKDLWR